MQSLSGATYAFSIISIGYEFLYEMNDIYLKAAA